MKFLLLDVANEKVEAVDIEPDLDEYYRLLDCRCIDIPSRIIGGRVFDIICDDEGLLVDNPKISAIDSDGNPMLVGNLMFCHHNEEGETVGLEDEEIAFLKEQIVVVPTNFYPEGYPMLVGCEYRD